MGNSITHMCLINSQTPATANIPDALKARLEASPRTPSPDGHHQARREAALQAKSTRGREVALHAKDVASQVKEAKEKVVREALQQVEGNLQRAGERRADLLRAKTTKAAVESQKVREIHQTRSAQKTARQEHGKQQQALAEERRGAALEAKTSRAAVESTKIRIVQQAREAELAAMEEQVNKQQANAQDRRRISLDAKTSKAAAANARVQEVLAAKLAIKSTRDSDQQQLEQHPEQQ